MRRVGGWSGRFGSKLSSDDASCLERLNNQLFCKEEVVIKATSEQVLGPRVSNQREA